MKIFKEKRENRISGLSADRLASSRFPQLQTLFNYSIIVYDENIIYIILECYIRMIELMSSFYKLNTIWYCSKE